MTRKVRRAIPTAFIGLCTLALLMSATPACAVALDNFDLQRSLPSLGVFGPIAIVVLRFLASLIGVVPTSPLLLAAGATQGVFLGTLYVLIGAQLGALVGFLIGRRVGRDFVVRRGWLDRVAQTRIGRWLLDENTPQSQLMLAVFLCRLLPGFNMDALSYVAGITPLSTWRFCLASFAALLPYTLLVVAAGQQLVAFGSDSLAIAVIGLLALSALVGLSRKHWLRVRAREKPALSTNA
ncbi:TVP38/TMEM64 family protein [Methyloceanibacter sp. wino2]|uniref:TVP38/TMEM64 family protein n=1 Tax=Methyloceanibacter sp. wino2 TaxID=2170729 RepID=UPI000D3E2FDD|nr:VTT domain-containing protein [Methyloceanibacter sp. wino2]